MTSKTVKTQILILVTAILTVLVFSSCRSRNVSQSTSSSSSPSSSSSALVSSAPAASSSQAASSAVSSSQTAASSAPAAAASSKTPAVSKLIAAAPTIGFRITSPASGSINGSTYVNVSGTSYGISQPMWYEIYQGDESGKMTDFGAISADSKWFFTARHLSAGLNTIILYAQLPNGKLQKSSVKLNYTVKSNPAIRPRPQPAEIWWGGLGQNQQLIDHPDSWEYVKKYMDAYFIHSAYWGGKDDLMKQLVNQLKPYGTKFAAELGGGTGSTDTWPVNQFNSWGMGKQGWLKVLEQNTGLVLSLATYDFHDNCKTIATDNPSFTPNNIVSKIGDYWNTYFKLNNEVAPYLKEANTWQPTWWWWQTYPPLGGDIRNSLAFTANNKSYSINGYDIMNALRTAGTNISGRNEWTFFSDSPYYSLVWNQGNQEGIALTNKIIAYEKWLHNNGSKHAFICNDAPNDVYLDTTKHAAWDQIFTQNSLKSLKIYQSRGGRADYYNFESWFSDKEGMPIPFKVIPEDTQYSYTWLAKQAIKYLKGISDNGTPEKMTLTKTVTGNKVTVTLTNKGDVECMPVLESFEAGSTGIVTKWLDSSSKDITSEIRSSDGWVCTQMLKPGASVSVSCQVSGSGGGSTRNISVEAYWNPQDPTGVVRGRVSWSVK